MAVWAHVVESPAHNPHISISVVPPHTPGWVRGCVNAIRKKKHLEITPNRDVLSRKCSNFVKFLILALNISCNQDGHSQFNLHKYCHDGVTPVRALTLTDTYSPGPLQSILATQRLEQSWKGFGNMHRSGWGMQVVIWIFRN